MAKSQHDVIAHIGFAQGLPLVNHPSQGRIQVLQLEFAILQLPARYQDPAAWVLRSRGLGLEQGHRLYPLISRGHFKAPLAILAMGHVIIIAIPYPMSVHEITLGQRAKGLCLNLNV